MKDKYFKALIEVNGSCNEIELGERLGLDENSTRRIIAQLLSEYKIEHVDNGLSEYSIMKNVSRKDKLK